MTAFKKWYAIHGEDLSKARRERYKNDPDYRQKQLERAARRRQAKANLRPAKPPGYTVGMPEAAETLGLSVHSLRDLQRKGCYPAALSHGGRYWFTPAQVELLVPLVVLIQQAGRRPSSVERAQIDNLIALTFVNWS